MPAAALAATKVAVQFTKDFKTTPQFDIDDHLVGGTVVSTTKELKWTPADPGEKKGRDTGQAVTIHSCTAMDSITQAATDTIR